MSAAEAEAFWRGVAHGARAAAGPARRHMPGGADLDLTRDGAEPALVSSRLADGWQAQAAEPGARAVRHDGWTDERIRLFIHTLADTGVVADACRACGMSRDAAYAFRRRAAGRAFGLAWDAAELVARRSVADDVMSRSRHGVVDRVYRNGELVAERHRYDNRLTMAVLTRLDRLAEGHGPKARTIGLVADEFDQFVDALPGGNAAAEAFLCPRLADDPLEPPHFRGAEYPMSSEPNLLARLAFRDRHGAGLPSDIPVDDLDPEEMESWDGDQIRRALASGFAASLGDDEWPEAALDGDRDDANGKCKLRQLYLDSRSGACPRPPAEAGGFRYDPSGAEPLDPREWGYDDEDGEEGG